MKPYESYNSNPLADLFSGKTNFEDWSKLFFYGRLKNLTEVDETTREKMQKAGISNIDIDFISHLNYVFTPHTSSYNNIYKFLEGNYDESGRTLSNKLLRGHTNMQELYTLLYKFKGR